MNCSVKKIFKSALGYKKELLKANLFALIATVTTVTVPLFIPLLIDELLLNKEPHLTKFVKLYIYDFSLTGYVLFFLLLVLVISWLVTNV